MLILQLTDSFLVSLSTSMRVTLSLTFSARDSAISPAVLISFSLRSRRSKWKLSATYSASATAPTLTKHTEFFLKLMSSIFIPHQTIEMLPAGLHRNLKPETFFFHSGLYKNFKQLFFLPAFHALCLSLLVITNTITEN